MPGMFGGGSNMGDAAMQAAQIQAAGTDRAARIQQEMYNDAVKREQPWVTAGGQALNNIGGLFNLPGYTPVNPTATLEATPGYNWMLGQGNQNLARYAAANGLTASGPAMKSVADWAQNAAINKAWNPYVTGLTNLSNLGQSGAALQGNQGLSTGNVMGQDYMNAGQALGQGVWQGALANYQANQNAANTWGELGGVGLGLAVTPWAAPAYAGASYGGLSNSLLGKAISGIGSWLGF